MKRLWVIALSVLAFACLMLLLSGCAGSASNLRPKAEDKPLLKNIHDVQITYSYDASVMSGWGNQVAERMRQDAELRCGARGLTIDPAEKKDAASTLSTSLWYSGSQESSYRGSSPQEGWMAAAFTLEYSIMDNGKSRKIFSETAESRLPIPYGQDGAQGRLHILRQASDSLMLRYSALLDELMTSFGETQAAKP